MHDLTKILELLVALAFAAEFAVASIIWPRVGIVIWLAVTCFVPAWLIVSIDVGWTPAGLMALVLIPAIIVRSPRLGWRLGDVVVAVMIVLVLLAHWEGGTPKAVTYAIVTRGLLAYFVSRHLAPRAGIEWTLNVFAVILLTCATWSIVEYVFNWHAFVGFDLGSPEGFWAEIQYRGGHARSDATFGQAIALGGSLAMAVPLIVASTWRTLRKILAVGWIATGVLATASRGPMIAVLVGVVLVLALYTSPRISVRQRRQLTACALAGGVIVYLALSGILTAAGTEASASASYRGELYSYVLSDVHPFSLASNMTLSHGQELYRYFGSVDSTFIYNALLFGWVPVALLMAALVALMVRVLRRRAGPAAIALVAQIPVLATVAPITQYGTLLWFLGGLVVIEGARVCDAASPAPEPAPAIASGTGAWRPLGFTRRTPFFDS